MSKYCADLQGGMWLQYSTSTNSWHAKPCCMYQTEYPVTANINQEFWQNPKIIQQRKDNLAGLELPDECIWCKRTESQGNYSRRQAFNDRLGTKMHMPDSVIEIDIQADFSCNLACRICKPELSTFWRQVDPQYKIDNKKFSIKANNNDVLNLLKTIPTHDIKQIHFQGGEPLLSNTHIQILELLQQQVDVSQLIVWYHTNGTQRVSDKVLKFWEKFKSIEIYFSLDDMGARMEYQRWPVKWIDLHNNALWYRENLPHNAMLYVERTVGVLNAFWVDELEKWHQQYFYESRYGDKISINYHACAETYSLWATSELYKQAVLNKFDPEHWVHKTFRNLQTNNTNRINELFQHLNRHDQLRNQSWKSVYPEFIEWYPDYAV
jgi:hypothetical protein